MKAAVMTRLIDEELSHIPRSHKGSTQNQFRMLYAYHRRRDLADDANAPARNALFAAIRAIEAGQHAMSPPLEWEFFRPGAGRTRRRRNGAHEGAATGL